MNAPLQYAAMGDAGVFSLAVSYIEYSADVFGRWGIMNNTGFCNLPSGIAQLYYRRL